VTCSDQGSLRVSRRFPLTLPTVCGKSLREWERALGRAGLTRSEAHAIVRTLLRPALQGALDDGQQRGLAQLAAEVFGGDV